jgi:hypothetical protein
MVLHYAKDLDPVPFQTCATLSLVILPIGNAAYNNLLEGVLYVVQIPNRLIDLRHTGSPGHLVRPPPLQVELLPLP